MCVFVCAHARTCVFVVCVCLKFVEDQTDKQVNNITSPLCGHFIHTVNRMNQKHIHYLVASHKTLFPILVSLVHLF